MADLNTAEELSNQAALCWRQGLYDQAEALIWNAVEIRSQILGPAHSETIKSLMFLATIYEVQGFHDHALFALECGLETLREAPRQDRIQTDVVHALIALCRKHGLFGEAQNIIKRELEIQDQAIEAGHPDTANHLSHLAHLHLLQGLYHQADQLFMRSLEIRQKALGELHPDVAISMIELAQAYLCQGPASPAVV